MDILRIEVIENSFFLTEQVNKTYAPIARNYTLKKPLLQQLNSKDSSIINGGKLFAKGVISAVVGTALMSVFL